MRYLWAFSLIFVCFKLVSASDVSVNTPFGTVVGFEQDGVCKFLGIPYAHAPIGPLRWKPTTQPVFFATPFNASSYGAACIQAGPFSAFMPNSTSEDCLFLNIYVPCENGVLNTSRRLPVQFWIHGGGYTSGTGSSYDGSSLAQLSAVVVTINYRLGVFGFWATTGLLNETSQLNFGFQDQQAAMRWVSTASWSFGADPRNMMIFGESAGGGSVFNHLFMPHSAPLFSAAMLESPGPWKVLSLADALIVNDYMILPPCGRSGLNPIQLVACLRTLNSSMVVRTVQGYPLPIIDNTTVLGQPMDLLTSPAALRRMSRAPLLLGNMLEEGNLFLAVGCNCVNGLNTSWVQSQLAYILPQYELANRTAAEQVLQLYLNDAPQVGLFAAVSDLYADEFINCGLALLAQAASQLSVPVFRYRFDHATVNWLFSDLNATHTGELPYLFPGFLNAVLNADEQVLASDFAGYVHQFLLSSNPNGGALPTWPPAGTDGATAIVFQTPRQYTTVQHPESPRCWSIWESILSAQ